MIRIISGRYGPKLLGPGTVLNLDPSKEEILVKKKIAVYVGEIGETDTDDGKEAPFKTFEELKRMRTKKELIEYAQSIGLHTLEEEDKKEVLIDAIANYIEEHLTGGGNGV